MMTLDELKEHVDLYSADLSRWPQDKVKAALQFTSENKEAKKYFDAALALDDRLRHFTPKQPDLNALESRIMAEIAKTPRAAPAKAAEISVTPAWIFAPGGALLAAAILGFIIGIMPAKPQNTDTLVDPVYYSQDIGGDSDDDMGEVF